MKKFFKLVVVMLSVAVLATSVAAAPLAQQPNVTFTLVQGLPATMQVGESHTVVVAVTSDQPFISGIALPSAYYPGARYILTGPGDHSQGGTSTTFHVPYVAKGSTADLPGGVAPVSVVAAVRFQGGITVYKQYDFLVAVP